MTCQAPIAQKSHESPNSGSAVTRHRQGQPYEPAAHPYGCAAHTSSNQVNVACILTANAALAQMGCDHGHTTPHQQVRVLTHRWCVDDKLAAACIVYGGRLHLNSVVAKTKLRQSKAANGL